MINGISMKRCNVAWSFVGGIGFGLSLALCLGAAEKKAEAPKLDWSRLQVVGYASGVTGILDPETGRYYLYDANVERCYAIREIRNLGEPMIRLRN